MFVDVKRKERKMNNINFLMIFDIVILGYGFWIMYGAVKMNKTKVPASMLIPEEDLIGSRDPEGFCEVMYKKTLVFGIICVLYGLAGFGSEIFFQSRSFNIVTLTIFIIAVLWFCKEMRSARHTYIR